MPRKWIDEDSAFEKYCPFRTKRLECGGDYPPEEAFEFCLSSNCMAWAWKDEKEDLGTCLIIPPMED